MALKKNIPFEIHWLSDFCDVSELVESLDGNEEGKF